MEKRTKPTEDFKRIESNVDATSDLGKPIRKAKYQATKSITITLKQEKQLAKYMADNNIASFSTLVKQLLFDIKAMRPTPPRMEDTED